MSVQPQEDTWAQEWQDVCNAIAKYGGPVGTCFANRILRHLTINAPVLLLFVTVCVMLHILKDCCFPKLGEWLGVHDTWQGDRWLQYTSLLTHILAHVDLNHLRGNMTHLLLTGPSVEHEFGSRNLLIIMVIVAVTSAFAHIFVGKTYSHQLGASGVVFACILLNSLVSADNGKVPLAFVLTAILYLGDEFAKFVWRGDAVSHHAHLVGGLVGAAAGFYIHRQRRRKKTKSIVQKWLTSSKKDKTR